MQPLSGGSPGGPTRKKKLRYVHWQKQPDGPTRATYRRVRPDRTEFRYPLGSADRNSDGFLHR